MFHIFYFLLDSVLRSSFCRRERLNFQVSAPYDIKMAARQGSRIGQKNSYPSRFY